MKHAALVIALIMMLPLPAGAQETSGSFTEGSIKIGYDSRTCSSALEGSLRYSSAADCIEFCDGLSWQTWGGG